MDLVVASNNAGKIKEIKEILAGHFVNIYSLKDVGIDVDVEETGVTFLENARLKAHAISKLTPHAVLSDDSGIEVNALGGAPGVYSARYSEEKTDAANNQKLLRELAGSADRRANFRSVVVLVDGDAEVVGEGTCLGEIVEPRGEGGFGYDPLFYSHDLNKTFGEATKEEKNTISHRKRALQDLLGKLNRA